MELTKVEGKDAGSIILFALSTCGWCKKARAFLDELGVGYSFVYVDKLNGDERDEAVEAMMKWNPARSFPTVVINDNEAVVGYKTEKIREAIGL